MESSRPGYWGGYPFSSPEALPNPGIHPRFPTLQVDSLPAEPQGKPKNTGVGNLDLLKQTFPTLESNRGLLRCRQIVYQQSYEGLELISKRSAINLACLLIFHPGRLMVSSDGMVRYLGQRGLPASPHSMPIP